MRALKGYVLFMVIGATALACNSGSRGSTSGTGGTGTSGSGGLVATFRYVAANNKSSTATLNTYDGTTTGSIGSPNGVSFGVSSVTFSRDFKFFFVASKDSDEIAAYSYDQSSGSTIPVDDPAGGGTSPFLSPRTSPFLLVKNPAVDVLYAICDGGAGASQTGSIVAYNISTTGVLQPQGSTGIMMNGVVDVPDLEFGGMAVGAQNPTGMTVFNFSQAVQCMALPVGFVPKMNGSDSGLFLIQVDPATGGLVVVSDFKRDQNAGGTNTNIRPAGIINIRNNQLFVASQFGIQPHILTNAGGLPAYDGILRGVIGGIGSATFSQNTVFAKFASTVYASAGLIISSFDYDASAGQPGGALINPNDTDVSSEIVGSNITGMSVASRDLGLVAVSDTSSVGQKNVVVLKIDQNDGSVDKNKAGTASGATGGDTPFSVAADRN